MCYTSHEIIFTNSERGKSMYFENDTDLYRVIGANIKNYREQAKLTQVQLAEQAKIRSQMYLVLRLVNFLRR